MTHPPALLRSLPFVAALAAALATSGAACLSDYGSDCDRNVDLQCFWETRGGNGGAGGEGTTTTPVTTTAADPVCGNAAPEPGEACDDGNTDDCDGCNADCTIVETGCGDGVVCGDEECDDGTPEGGDGCAACLSECVAGSLAGGPAAPPTFADPTTLHCYIRVSASPKSWIGALQQCQSWGGDLVAFTDLAEHAAVTAALPAQGAAWTGGRGKLTPAEFTWSNGEPWPQDAPWAPAQPDSTTEECVELTVEDTLDDVNCNKLSGFLCERDMTQSPP